MPYLSRRGRFNLSMSICHLSTLRMFARKCHLVSAGPCTGLDLYMQLCMAAHNLAGLHPLPGPEAPQQVPAGPPAMLQHALVRQPGSCLVQCCALSDRMCTASWGCFCPESQTLSPKP